MPWVVNLVISSSPATFLPVGELVCAGKDLCEWRGRPPGGLLCLSHLHLFKAQLVVLGLRNATCGPSSLLVGTCVDE